MRYSLTALRAFEAAGRHLSLTKAAAELVVTRPAVSKQIRLLETDLGTQLLLRTSGGVVLTDEGQDLFRTVSSSFSKITDTADRISQLQTGPTRLRVLVEYDFGAAWLAKNIGHYLIEHSAHTVDLQTSKQDALRLDEPFDLRIFYSNASTQALESDRFDSIELCGWSNLPLCAPGYLQAQRSGQKVPLSGSKLLHDRDRRLWRDWLSFAGMDPAIAQTGGTVFDSTAGCLAAAAAGAGIGIGDTLTALDMLRAGQLIAPFEQAQPSDVRYLLMIDRGTKDKVDSRLFVNWLRDGMQSLRAEQCDALSRLGM